MVQGFKHLSSLTEEKKMRNLCQTHGTIANPSSRRQRHSSQASLCPPGTAPQSIHLVAGQTRTRRCRGGVRGSPLMIVGFDDVDVPCCVSLRRYSWTLHKEYTLANVLVQGLNGRPISTVDLLIRRRRFKKPLLWPFTLVCSSGRGTTYPLQMCRPIRQQRMRGLELGVLRKQNKKNTPV
jgi:hypothetical protein